MDSKIRAVIFTAINGIYFLAIILLMLAFFGIDLFIIWLDKIDTDVLKMLVVFLIPIVISAFIFSRTAYKENGLKMYHILYIFNLAVGIFYGIIIIAIVLILISFGGSMAFNGG